jgi:formylmethanofuran dehydrogenase subunit D
MEVILITGRTFRQGEAIEKGKNLDSYTEAVAICELDPVDMERLGIEEKDTIKISTKTGEVLVKAVRSAQYPHKGIVFMPLGPWANAVVGFGTNSTGMPSFKGITAIIEPAKDKEVLSASELIKNLYRKGER